MEANLTFTSVLLAVAILITVYTIVSWIIMTSYNYSVTKMNPSWKPMDFKVAFAFTIFTQMIFRSPMYKLMDDLQ